MKKPSARRRITALLLSLLPLAAAHATESDEFDRPETLSTWKILDQDKASGIDIDSSRKGHLTLQIKDLNDNGWYMNGRGVFVFKEIQGNFAAETKLRVGRISDAGQWPRGLFNSAGFVVRDPASTSGKENWIMVNIGYQYAGLGRETKTTRNSHSELNLIDIPTTANTGKLLICRVGNIFRMYHWLAHETDWVAEDTPREFKRDDFPATVQVGLTINAYETPRETLAEFDYVRFSKPISFDDCLSNASKE
ncbi:MAG: hypothetical protein H6R18_1344 [Proteobacteria bacterium]|nr:hypothetical protein [Pseudomonadota bacterium]